MAFNQSSERSGWRDHQDEKISVMHQRWHRDLKLVDLDTVWVEYKNDFGKPRPAAIIDYKAFLPVQLNLNEWQYAIQRQLADGVQVPFFIVFRTGTEAFLRFTVRSGNWRASNAIKEFTGRKHSGDAPMDEEGFIRFQCFIRNQPVPEAELRAYIDGYRKAS